MPSGSLPTNSALEAAGASAAWNVCDLPKPRQTHPTAEPRNRLPQHAIAFCASALAADSLDLRSACISPEQPSAARASCAGQQEAGLEDMGFLCLPNLGPSSSTKHAHDLLLCIPADARVEALVLMKQLASTSQLFATLATTGTASC